MSIGFFGGFAAFIGIVCFVFGYLVGRADGKHESEIDLISARADLALANESARQYREALMQANDAMIEAMIEAMKKG